MLACPPTPPAGSGDQFNAAQLNSIIANQQQANTNSGVNTNAIIAQQTNVAGSATNTGGRCCLAPAVVA